MLWTCTFCRFRSKLDSYDVDNLSMLTAFFPLCCVIRWKMTWRIRRPSGAMLYACKKVSMLTAMAQGRWWMGFFFFFTGKCCVEVELSGRIDFFSLLCRCCSVVELSGRIDFFSLLCRCSSRILLA